MGSTTLGTFLELRLVDSLSWVFQQLDVIYRRFNFVYHYRGWTSIYRQLSYPFRSLVYRIYVDILTGGKFVVNLACSFIGLFIHPVDGDGVGKGCIIVLASYEHYFIKVHENLVQHPCNNISIYKPWRQSFKQQDLCLSIPKDLANHWTDMVLIYNVDSHRSWDGL